MHQINDAYNDRYTVMLYAMRGYTIRILLFVLFLLLSADTQAQTAGVQVSLLTCEPGAELYSTFGHSAIRVRDVRQDIDVVYNYGIFDFDEPNFYGKFLRGKLLYFLGVYSYGDFLRDYHRQSRTVREQVLDLDSMAIRALVGFLNENYRPENRFYLYDFFFDNCSSRIRDAFEDALPGFRYDGTPDRQVTYRQLLDEYLTTMPWSDFGIDLIIGAVADDTADFRAQMFLPDYLHDHMERARILNEGTEVPLMRSDEVILDFEYVPPPAKSWFTPALCFWLLFGLEVLLFVLTWRKRPRWLVWHDRLWVLILALSSALMLVMWLGTNHQACAQNWNLLWANPLYIALFPILLFRKKRSARYLIMVIGICTILALLGWSIIPQQYHVACIPIMLTALIVLFRLCKNSDGLRVVV